MKFEWSCKLKRPLQHSFSNYINLGETKTLNFGKSTFSSTFRQRWRSTKTYKAKFSKTYTQKFQSLNWKFWKHHLLSQILGYNVQKLVKSNRRCLECEEGYYFEKKTLYQSFKWLITIMPAQVFLEHSSWILLRFPFLFSLIIA